ncbi:MAG TPA: hypothetical protein GXX31_01475 [Methanothermobacter sp.]|uniref:DUF2119 domain-containing protein n=1 Tax=Methanothermobacter tenebrarum TaxID=680118 RepID=A0ABM7YDY8_9EURY|nr:hypothetical protein [Methanothermobacter sp.]BDH79435.1 hypothetical protein MTTB_08140 [Methanothermobacter tenebrarum]HHW16044.1 hypothetical protein [Methanothermobacter sp.]HOQ19478.1 hypothetical protein [Methanothermobacter sp.]
MEKARILILTLIIVTILSLLIYQPNGKVSEIIIGKNEYGEVIREGPFGDPNSPDRVAYIVGVHPHESQAHEAIIKAIRQEDKSLKKCYYIYKVNVTRNPNDYEEGRLNGQLLAREYVIPDIERMSIKLVIDVHSNVGRYDERRFLFIPYPSDKTRKIANMITDRIGWLQLYEPPNPTSPEYVTIPLIKRGIPAIVYETYAYETPEQTFKQAKELILVIDSLSFLFE